MGQPCRPPRVIPSAHRGSRSPARQYAYWYSDCAAPSFTFSVVAKKRHCLSVVLRSRTTLITRTRYQVHILLKNRRWRPYRARSCIPRVSRHRRRLGTKEAPALFATPPLPASIRWHTRRRRARPRCCTRSTRTHTKPRKKKGETTESAKRNGEKCLLLRRN